MGSALEKIGLIRSGVARHHTADGTVELYYQDLGDPAAPPALLIMGLGGSEPR